MYKIKHPGTFARDDFIENTYTYPLLFTISSGVSKYYESKQGLRFTLIVIWSYFRTKIHPKHYQNA